MSKKLADITSVGSHIIRATVSTEDDGHLDLAALKTQLHEVADMLNQEWANHETTRLGLNGDQE